MQHIKNFFRSPLQIFAFIIFLCFLISALSSVKKHGPTLEQQLDNLSWTISLKVNNYHQLEDNKKLTDQKILDLQKVSDELWAQMEIIYPEIERAREEYTAIESTLKATEIIISTDYSTWAPAR